jgi:hypothetical protein
VMPCIIMKDIEGDPQRKMYFVRWHPRLSSLIGDLLGELYRLNAYVAQGDKSTGYGINTVLSEGFPDRRELVYTLVRSRLPPADSCCCFFNTTKGMEVEPDCGCEILASLTINAPISELLHLLGEEWPFHNVV